MAPWLAGARAPARMEHVKLRHQPTIPQLSEGGGLMSNLIKDAEAIPVLAHIGLILALASVLVLCIPFVGYAAIPFSSMGVLLGVCQVYRSLAQGDGKVGYALAAIGACLVSLLLGLLPVIH